MEYYCPCNTVRIQCYMDTVILYSCMSPSKDPKAYPEVLHIELLRKDEYEEGRARAARLLQGLQGDALGAPRPEVLLDKAEVPGAHRGATNLTLCLALALYLALCLCLPFLLFSCLPLLLPRLLHLPLCLPLPYPPFLVPFLVVLPWSGKVAQGVLPGEIWGQARGGDEEEAHGPCLRKNKGNET